VLPTGAVVPHDLKQHQLPAISSLNTIYDKQSSSSATFWPKLVYDCAQRLITVESTRKDVLSLPLTYKYIVEHGGQYAPIRIPDVSSGKLMGCTPA
jgi:hypothetical protein